VVLSILLCKVFIGSMLPCERPCHIPIFRGGDNMNERCNITGLALTKWGRFQELVFFPISRVMTNIEEVRIDFFAWVSGAHPDFRNVRPFVHGQLKQNRSTKFLNTPSSVLQIIWCYDTSSNMVLADYNKALIIHIIWPFSTCKKFQDFAGSKVIECDCLEISLPNE
jgi:hypothetical protein